MTHKTCQSFNYQRIIITTRHILTLSEVSVLKKKLNLKLVVFVLVRETIIVVKKYSRVNFMLGSVFFPEIGHIYLTILR